MKNGGKNKSVAFIILFSVYKNFSFSKYLDCFAPSDSRFSNSCISAKYCPILTNHTSMESSFIQIIYKSQFKKIDT